MVWNTNANSRIIQQAIAQVLTPIYEPKFSNASYGYRLQRSAKDAILKVMKYANEGYKFAVCLDLSKYFDTFTQTLNECATPRYQR